MNDRFDICLAEALKWEGGWSNHPRDPGGPTIRGIIQRVYDGWRDNHGLPRRSVGWERRCDGIEETALAMLDAAVAVAAIGDWATTVIPAPGNAGESGTGGVLAIYVEGTYSGSGAVTAAGANGGAGGTFSVGGPGSGGGSVTIMVGTNDSGPTPTAAGGLGRSGSAGDSPRHGGNGTARILPITPDP